MKGLPQPVYVTFENLGMENLHPRGTSVMMTTVPDVGELIDLGDGRLHKVATRFWRVDPEDDDTTYCRVIVTLSARPS